MYQIHADIFRKLAIYVKIAKQFKEDIETVEVRNEIKEHFGKTYCRVHVNIKLKNESSQHYELQNELWNNLNRYGDSEYFSFHIRTAHREEDDHRLRNLEENTHYDYIWNLLAWYLEKDELVVEAAEFVSQLDLKRKEQKWHEKYEKERRVIENAVETITFEIGQLIAIKQWHNDSLRIGQVENISHNKRRFFSMELAEIKKDLKAGKIRINVWNKTEVYAIVQPDKLPKGKIKTALITSLEIGENFEGLVWRRPQELW